MITKQPSNLLCSTGIAAQAGDYRRLRRKSETKA